LEKTNNKLGEVVKIFMVNGNNEEYLKIGTELDK